MMERLMVLLRKSGDWIAPIAAVSMVFVMLVPLPSFILDLSRSFQSRKIAWRNLQRVLIRSKCGFRIACP